MLKKIVAVPLMIALLIPSGGVNAQYNPTGAVTNQQPNSPNYQRHTAYIDSTLAGGVGGGLPPSSVSTPMPDPCTKFPALKACQPPESSGGGSGAKLTDAAHARCVLVFSNPSGGKGFQGGSMDFGDGHCNRDNGYIDGGTSVQGNMMYEAGDSGTQVSGAFYPSWTKTKANEWEFAWEGNCTPVKLGQECNGPKFNVTIGTSFTDSVKLTMRHKTTGEVHVKTITARMSFCGAIVNGKRQGCI